MGMESNEPDEVFQGSFACGQMCIESDKFLEINEQHCINFCDCANIVTEIIEIEEKFSLVVENFVEYEKEMASLSIDKAYFSDFPAFLAEDRKLLNRRIMNILTASRLYLDHIRGRLSVSVFGDSHTISTIKTALNNQRTSNFSFRLVDALRNHTQHHALPVKGISYHHRWNRIDDENRELTTNISIQLHVPSISQDIKFDRNLLQELSENGDYIELKMHIRNYIESISIIHTLARENYHVNLEISLRFLEELKDQYIEHSKCELPAVGLGVLKKPRRERSKSFAITRETASRTCGACKPGQARLEISLVA